MPPKTKKQQTVQEDTERDAIKVGPAVHWLIRDAATTPLVPCPVGRCYANAAIYDGRLYVFGGWNGLSRAEALKTSKCRAAAANLQPLNRNLLNAQPPKPATPPAASLPLHVPAPPSSAPAGASKKKPATPQSPGASPKDFAASTTTAGGGVATNNFFGNTSLGADGSSLSPPFGRLGGAAAGNNNNLQPIHSIPHPCHERDVLCFDIGTSAWSVLDSVLGAPHPGTSQCGMAELGGAVMLFGGWDGYRRHGALTLFSQSEDRWKPFVTNPSESAPPPLSFHAVCGYGRKLFVFGGETADGVNADMYILELTSLNWSVAPAAGIPQRRTCHTMTVLQGLYVVIFGGRNADGAALSDVAIFDINSNHWVVGVKAVGVGPARYAHSAVAVGDRSILIYGGVGPRVGPATGAAGGPFAAGAAGGGAGGGAAAAGAGAAGGAGGGGKGEKGGEKEREAQQSAALVSAIGSYEIHSDVWLLTMGDKLGTVTWERCQVRTSLEPAAPRGLSPARSVSLAGDSGAPTPMPPNEAALTNANNAANGGGGLLNAAAGAGASAIHSLAGSRVTTPAPGFGGTLGGGVLMSGGQQLANAAPTARCGHTASLFGGVMYVFGGRTDSIGTVCKDIAVLDVAALLPPPPAPPTEGRGTRLDTESTMRAPSSAMTQ